MVTYTPHQLFEATFGHLPKKQFEVIEDLWALRGQLDRTKGWWARYKIKSSIKELEREAFRIGLDWAIKSLLK
jgi:hypothetical protein